MRYEMIPAALFSERRQAFAKKMKPNSMAIFHSNDLMPRSGDQHFTFRQDSALFALSGLDQSGTSIVLYPDAKNAAHREIAFILPSDPEHAIWNGDRLDPKHAKKISGITTIRSTQQWDKIMAPLFRAAEIVYVNNSEQPFKPGDILTQNEWRGAELKRLHPGLSFLSAQSILRQILMIKHPAEINLMTYAVNVTGLAFDRVLKTMRPGLKEFEVEAEITYELSRNGCHHAFHPIVASGKAACTLHYILNNQTIRPDTLVLLDFGAEYAYMASDMSRTIPASGRFTKRQRQIYTSVLNVLNGVTEMMTPGITLDQINKEAGKRIEHELVNLKIISKSEIRRQVKGKPLWKKYFMHGVSHHLGYDVHDTSDRSVPLKSGMVLTCEPGIYIPEENIGIRLENDILITKRGPQNLMKSIPVDPDEIEMIMNKRPD